MIYLTNKPIEQVLPAEGKHCKIFGMPIADLLQKDFSAGVVVDVWRNSGVINQVLSVKKPQWMRGVVELTQGSTVYVVQELTQNVLVLAF